MTEENEKNSQINKAQFNFSLEINKEGEYLDSVSKKSTWLELLAQQEDLEIIKQNIVADKVFKVEGSEGVFEFFYLLKGRIKYLDNDRILNAGDYITTKNLKKQVYFKTLTEVDLIYVTNTPIFSNKQKEIKKLLELNEEIEARDQQTRDHCRRLQDLSRRTGEELDLSQDKLFSLIFASFLHDIGKANVPVEILQKPAKLSPEEWSIVKKHPEKGKKMILEHMNSSFFERVAEIILQHHENYDGSGYPQGLAGEEIMIEAQILSVVDSYDAMSHRRPYQEAKNREEVLAEIKRCKGQQFAPRVVDAFLKAEQRFITEGIDPQELI